MELKNLHTFTTVAETGSVANASRKLHCVQSNVTTRIKSLEAELGVELFNRSRSGMALTAAGTAFLPLALDVERAVKRAHASVEAFDSSVKLLRIGSMESTLAIRLPKIIASFRKKYPDMRLQIHSGPTDDLLHKLVKDQVDIAIIGGKFARLDMKAQPLFTEEMVMISSSEITEVGQLRSLPVIVFKQGCSYRDYARRWMRLSGLAPNDIFELGTLDGILGCVASGVGISCLPRSVIEGSRHKELLTIHALDDPERFIDTYAMQNTGVTRNGAAEAFLKFVVA
ncbi:DNA-binding transcriptional regulator, LysR family [Roseovarius marisflavi]|uniref:DNA-binding transcriptional regulator, LysR family n=1 Tax=Roseovarius marisflavi TaxID=1054996 RepID=A0A1M7DIQ9_9RHOB|nr:LysR family transcriptional regulator [Roseovarius marisflavi]SHL79411.1 DNA-binding transcriptional regulator, LysR family [Roseovarius marisflavi]